ncbi:MAG: Dabb family protein [Acidimicrobiales bacterium]|nr:Dabb family protein [Actinomycetota bacterium]
MLRHVAVFTFTPETTDAQVQALIEGLGRLPNVIPEIREYRFGPDVGEAEGNDAFAVVADFEDVEAYRRYAGHPAHQELIVNLIRPILATRHAVQFVPASPCGPEPGSAPAT